MNIIYNIREKCRAWWYDRQERVIYWMIHTIRFFYPEKNNYLAYKLHDLAGTYQTRPYEGWLPPPEWDCWEDLRSYGLSDFYRNDLTIRFDASLNPAKIPELQLPIA